MISGMPELVRTSLVTLGALFPIVNPLGNAPIFLTLTDGYSSSEQALLARKVALNGFALLVGSILIGTHILAFFGISLPVVQIGGGMVVMASGWGLLQSKNGGPATDDNPCSPKMDLASHAFYPLTLPLTVGPGSISVAITLGADWAGGRAVLWPLFFAALIGPAIVALTIYLSYRFAERLARFLGQTAMNVILRLSSFILLCIGVQILWNGVNSLLGATLRR